MAEVLALPQGVSYLPAEAYPPLTDDHEPFEPTNMTGSKELESVNAELSALFGKQWCHRQLPNALWNQFSIESLHYTVGEWLVSTQSGWVDGPIWLKVALSRLDTLAAKKYADLKDDDEVKILTSGDVNARVFRVKL